MDSLIYSIGIDGLARAYHASMKAFDAEKSSIESDWQLHLAAVAAGTAETFVEDDINNTYFDYGEYTGELLDNVEDGKRHIREAFAIALYHYWEKKSAYLLKMKYEIQKTLTSAKAAGWKPNEDIINRMRLVANCIKHDSKSSADLNSIDPSYFDQATIQHGWHDALRLTDAHLESFIQAVKEGGPPMKKWLGKPQVVTL